MTTAKTDKKSSKRTIAKTTRRTLGRSTLGERKQPTSEPSKHNKTQRDSTDHDTTGPIATQPVTSLHNQYLNSGLLPHSTQIRIDAHLFDSVKNAIDSAIWGGNYEFESTSHFLREALREHARGKPLTVAHKNGPRKQLSLKLDDDLKDFWNGLPKRHRQNILERAVRTKLQEYAG